MNYLLRHRDDDSTSKHVFSDITSAFIIFIILFIFIQQFKVLEVFKQAKISILQRHVRAQIESSFRDRGYSDRIPRIEVNSANPLVQKIIMTSSVLKFPSGSIDLQTRDDENILHIVGEILKENNTLFEALKIEGHADTMALSSAAQLKFPTNWELSTGRATTVVRFLQEKTGIPPAQMSAVGFSIYHPIHRDSLNLNRRIEFVIQYSYAAEFMHSPRAKEIYEEYARKNQPNSAKEATLFQSKKF